MSSQELANGKYKILRRLAVGGMAEIYLAEAANIHGFRKTVVIKRILPQYATDSSYVDMFLDEARLVARLNHPSIVQVFDIGEEDNGVFFTMEYIEGHDLAEILGACYKRKRQLSIEEVLAVLTPMSEALHHAHELRDEANQLANLVHRDVSPSNVLVTSEGRVKLLDFGVAKSRAQLRETTGVSLKGKFGYMAPEQCQGLELDRRADIFSLGVVMWELVTGRRLYPGGNEPAVLLKIMNEDSPSPRAHRPDLDPALEAICMKALARNREERYSSLQELLFDVDDFRRDSGIVTSSRTLSRMIADVFVEDRPTISIEVQKKDERRSLPLKASTPGLASPSPLSLSGLNSQQQASSYVGATIPTVAGSPTAQRDSSGPIPVAHPSHVSAPNASHTSSVAAVQPMLQPASVGATGQVGVAPFQVAPGSAVTGENPYTGYTPGGVSYDIEPNRKSVRIWVFGGVALILGAFLFFSFASGDGASSEETAPEETAPISSEEETIENRGNTTENSDVATPSETNTDTVDGKGEVSDSGEKDPASSPEDTDRNSEEKLSEKGKDSNSSSETKEKGTEKKISGVTGVKKTNTGRNKSNRKRPRDRSTSKKNGDKSSSTWSKDSPFAPE